MKPLRPVVISPAAWAALTESQRDLIAVETVERIAGFPELVPLVTHELEHAARLARRFVETRPKRVVLSRLEGSQRLAVAGGRWA